MLFESNKFFDLKSKATSVKLVKSINLYQFFNFLLHITGKSCHILRFNYLEMCYFLVYLPILGFPIVGGMRVGTPTHRSPTILRFFFENFPYQTLRSFPHVWNTCGKLCICETQVHNCTESIIFGIPHPKVL